METAVKYKSESCCFSLQHLEIVYIMEEGLRWKQVTVRVSGKTKREIELALRAVGTAPDRN